MSKTQENQLWNSIWLQGFPTPRHKVHAGALPSSARQRRSPERPKKKAFSLTLQDLIMVHVEIEMEGGKAVVT